MVRGPLLTAGVRHAYSPTVYSSNGASRERKEGLLRRRTCGRRRIAQLSERPQTGPRVSVPGKTTAECHAVAAAPALTNLLLALPPDSAINPIPRPSIFSLPIFYPHFRFFRFSKDIFLQVQISLSYNYSLV